MEALMETILGLDPATQLEICQTVLRSQTAGRRPYNHWFKHPVDLERYPTYLLVVDTPMDFGTIRGKLDSGQYNGAAEFIQDVYLIYQNCYKLNPEDSEVYQAVQKLEESFIKKWTQLLKIHSTVNYKALHNSSAESPTSGHVDDDSSDSESDDLSESSDEPDNYTDKDYHGGPEEPAVTSNPHATRTARRPSRGLKEARLRKSNTKDQSPPRQQSDQVRDVSIEMEVSIRPKRSARSSMHSDSGTPPAKRARTEETVVIKEEAQTQENSISISDDEASAPVKEFEEGTIIVLDVGGNKLIGCVKGYQVLISAGTAKMLYELDTGGENTMFMFAKDLVKVRYQMNDLVPMRLGIAGEERCVKIRLLGVMLIDEVVHYEFKVVDQTFNVPEHKMH